MSYTPHHILFTPHALDSAAVPLPYRDTQGCAGRLVNFCDYVTIREALAERTVVTGNQPDVTGLYPWMGYPYPDFQSLCSSVRSACSNFVQRDYVPSSGTGEWVASNHALAPVSPDLTANDIPSQLRTFDHVRRMFRDLANMRRMVFSGPSGVWQYKFTFDYTGYTRRNTDGTTSARTLSNIYTVHNSFTGNLEGDDGNGGTWSTGEWWENIASVTPTLVGVLPSAVRGDASFALLGGWAIGQISARRFYYDDDGALHSNDYSSYVPMSIDATTHVIDTTAISGPALKAFCASNGYTDHETQWQWSASGAITNFIFDIDFPTNFDDANWTWTPS